MTEKIQRNLAIVLCFLVAGILVPIVYAMGDARIEKQISEIRIPSTLTESQEASTSQNTTGAESAVDSQPSVTEAEPPAGMTVTFPDVEYTPADGDSPIVRGRVVDAQTGKPIADLPVIFFGESFGGRTDEDGFFSVYTLVSGVHRMYFMGNEAVDDPKRLYQVISVKGYEGVINFSL